jgi:integrase
MPRREALHRPRQLTEAMVDKLKPPTERQYDNIYDALVPGLVLRVNRGGRKAWHVLFYENGKPRTKQLERYPILKVREAREAARAFRADPQKALAKADAETFKQVAEDWLRDHVEAKGLRTRSEIVRCLKQYVFPLWGARQFTEIKRKDIKKLLDRIANENGPVQADAVLAQISSICSWYQTWDDDYTSPIVKGMKRRKQAERARTRVLDDAELRAVWKAASACGVFGAFVQVLLLTGQRKSKVADMRHADIVDGMWTIRTAPREKGNAGTLRLPAIVLDIIAAQPRVAGNPYVFVGGRSGKPLSSLSDGKEALDRTASETLPGIPRWTLHDLRRTARTLMERADVRPDIGERVLGHKIPGVEGIYRRHHYEDEKADALKQLAHQIETILNPPKGNVVALTERRKKRSTTHGNPAVRG